MGILTTASILFLIAITVVEKPATVQVRVDRPAPPVTIVEKPAGTGFSGRQAQAKKVRIGTWNLRDCAATDKAGERVSFHGSIAGAIRDAGVDIIVLEEVQVDSKKGGDIALLSVALAEAGWAMPYVCSIDPAGEDDLAIFSKYPIRSSGEFAEPSEDGQWPRPGISASIEVDGARLDIFGFHFKAMSDHGSEAERRAQAAAVARELDARYGSGLSTAAIVLAGDFNTTNARELLPKNSTMSILAMRDDTNPGNDFLDVNYRFFPQEPTFTDNHYCSVLDHVLVSPALARTVTKDSVRIVPAPDGHENIPVSDHRMVVVDLRLPDAGDGTPAR